MPADRSRGSGRSWTREILSALRLCAGQLKGASLRVRRSGRSLHGYRVDARSVERTKRAGQIQPSVRGFRLKPLCVLAVLCVFARNKQSRVAFRARSQRRKTLLAFPPRECSSFSLVYLFLFFLPLGDSFAQRIKRRQPR